jgi:ribosomal protein L23
MAEFRDMMEQQMARSASVLYTVAGGGSANRGEIAEAMKTEFAYQVRTVRHVNYKTRELSEL